MNTGLQMRGRTVIVAIAFAEAGRLVIGVRGGVGSVDVATAAGAFDREISALLFSRPSYEEGRCLDPEEETLP